MGNEKEDALFQSLEDIAFAKREKAHVVHRIECANSELEIWTRFALAVRRSDYIPTSIHPKFDSYRDAQADIGLEAWKRKRAAIYAEYGVPAPQPPKYPESIEKLAREMGKR